jgi:glucose-1-phosphate cytidylyltransferase
MIKGFEGTDRTASFLCVRPSQSFHMVHMDGDNVVSKISHASKGNLRINGGYFVLRKDVFDYMKAGEELVEEPFQRLIEKKKLAAYKYDGFFVSMDTFKERQALEEMYAAGNAPWTMWAHKRP